MRKETAESLMLLGISFLFSLPLIILAVHWLRQMSPYGVFPLILVAFLIVPPLCDLIFSGIGGVIFPRKVSKSPHLAFSKPESMIMDGNYDKALEKYMDMINKAPNNIEIYLAAMKLASEKMGNPDIVREYFSLGVRYLDNLSDRKRLVSEYKYYMRHWNGLN
ncbi:MAG: hypothetical protein GF388_05780 [Candidatus Aegiribacteria sp.]|nr:hypothetical protein [Candidatus Aegiribacteria sp.]